MKEHNCNEELELQSNQHCEELRKRFQELKLNTDQSENIVPSLSIPAFDGEPTKWRSYWQQFETMHAISLEIPSCP